MAVLIDTSIFISAERRGVWSVNTLLAQLDGEPGALASITAAELLVGVHRADSPVRRSRREAYVESVFAQLPIISLDLRVARILAALTAQLVGEGQVIGTYDLIIAATALAERAPILTENVRHFIRVPGLDVRGPIW